MPIDTSNDIVISARKLSKVYKLYRSPKDRLKEALHPGRKKYHKDFFALRDVDLEVRRGEVLGIVGKNGSGKSTLLKILSKVLTPSGGDFMVKGKVSSLLELGSGFNPELTGMENIFFYGTILGFSEEKIRGKLDEILDFAEIGDFVHQPLKTYSSGMKARLAFSVAVNVEPDILILDEVLAVGDELFKRKCYARMEQFFKGEKTILFVSHSVSDINQFCTRAVMLDGGELILEGPAKLVTTHYQKLLFSTPSQKAIVRKEIICMNADIHLKESVLSDLQQTAKKTTVVNKDYVHKASPLFSTDHKAYYINNLKPKSTVVFKNYDIEIYDICMLSGNNHKVNSLLTGEDYTYSYKVKFNCEASDVGFSMLFKTEKGFKLSGASTKNISELIDHAHTGSAYEVKWRFTCNLLKGNYYTNAGVASFSNGKQKVLCRIVDAMIFKVQGINDRVYNGSLFINQKPEIEKF